MSGKTGVFLSTIILLMMLFSGCVQNAPEKATPTPTQSQMQTPQPQDVYTVCVDFSKREGIPLFKKFALFNSGIAPIENYNRDIYTLDDIDVESLRVDLFFGNREYTFGETLTGSADDIQYDFSTLDEWIGLLDDNGIRPYMSWCYIPIPLQENNDWRSGPTDLDKWQETHRVYAQHCKELGIEVYHEIYNEPDLGDVFFTGSWQDYLDLYRYGAKGLLQGDSEAIIGGPSTAIIETQMQIADFLDMVIDEELPLDFFSFHSYPQDGTYTERGYIYRSQLANQLLSENERFDITELHMNEINTIPWPWPVGGPLDNSLTAVLMLQSFKDLLEETDLTLVHWAQWLSSTVDGLGMVEKDGKIKSTMHAYRMYGQMPLGRVAIENKSLLEMMASADDDLACLIMWNDGELAQKVTISLDNIPFDSGEIEVYLVDDIHYPYPDMSEFELEPYKTLGIEESEFELAIQGHGFAFIKAVNTTDNAAYELPEAKIVRKYHYYPNRGAGNYAEFNEGDWSAWLGMGMAENAISMVGLEIDNSQDMYDCVLDITDEVSTMDVEEYLGVRLDYMVDDEYVKSVEYSLSDEAYEDTFPWGTEKEADELLALNDISTVLELQKYAPEVWQGRAIITFILKDTRQNSEAVFKLREHK